MGKPNGNLLASFSGLLSGIKMDFLCFFFCLVSKCQHLRYRLSSKTDKIQDRRWMNWHKNFEILVCETANVDNLKED